MTRYLENTIGTLQQQRADIEALIKVFEEIAPGLVTEPAMRLAVGEEVAEDADLQAVADARGGLPLPARNPAGGGSPAVGPASATTGDARTAPIIANASDYRCAIARFTCVGLDLPVHIVPMWDGKAAERIVAKLEKLMAQ